MGRNVLEKKNFEKTFPKKTFFVKKNKVLVYRYKKHFLSKIKCPLNYPFSKTGTVRFALT